MPCRYIFVSTTVFGMGTFRNSLNVYDDACVLMANGSTVPSVAARAHHFISLFSNTTVTAKSRIPNDDVCFMLTDNNLVANNREDLFDRSILAPISINQHGVTRGRYGDCFCMWSGSSNTGGLAPFGVCPGWGGTAQQGMWGSYIDGGTQWLDFRNGGGGTRWCSISAPIYCIDIGPAPIPSPTLSPSATPSLSPSATPSLSPSPRPSSSPTGTPTQSPTTQPSNSLSSYVPTSTLPLQFTTTEDIESIYETDDSLGLYLFILIFVVYIVCVVAGGSLYMIWRRRRLLKVRQLNSSKRSSGSQRRDCSLAASHRRSLYDLTSATGKRSDSPSHSQSGSPRGSQRKSKNRSRRSLASTSPQSSSSGGVQSNAADWYALHYLKAPPTRASPTLSTEGDLRKRERMSPRPGDNYAQVDTVLLPMSVEGELYSDIALKSDGMSDNTLPSNARVPIATPVYEELRLMSKAGTMDTILTNNSEENDGYGRSPGGIGIYKDVPGYRRLSNGGCSGRASVDDANERYDRSEGYGTPPEGYGRSPGGVGVYKNVHGYGRSPGGVGVYVGVDGDE